MTYYFVSLVRYFVSFGVKSIHLTTKDSKDNSKDSK